MRARVRVRVRVRVSVRVRVRVHVRVRVRVRVPGQCAPEARRRWRSSLWPTHVAVRSRVR